MEKDNIYEKVIESARDIKYIREDIAELKRELQESTEANEKRITDIEKIQNLNTGKLAIVLMLFGAGILGAFQFALMLWEKIPK